MMIAMALGLLAATLLYDCWMRPRLQRMITTTADRTLLVMFRVWLVSLSVLTGLCSVWLALDWWGRGFAWNGAGWILIFPTAAAAYLTWPPAWLSARIEGLRALANAVEDRPDWKEYTRG
jgi:hypothetical protein